MNSPTEMANNLTLLKDQSGRNRGIAFIRYSKKSEADYAISELNGYHVPGETLKSLASP